MANSPAASPHVLHAGEVQAGPTRPGVAQAAQRQPGEGDKRRLRTRLPRPKCWAVAELRGRARSHGIEETLPTGFETERSVRVVAWALEGARANQSPMWERAKDIAGFKRGCLTPYNAVVDATDSHAKLPLTHVFLYLPACHSTADGLIRTILPCDWKNIICGASV